ncbi:MAG: adenylate/guanylate cyclase domain-containing protein [Chthoniobacteraceae bacterium]
MTLDFNTGAADASPKARRRISLRMFLSLLMLALSLLTVGGTGLIAYKLSYRSLTDLKEREFTLKNKNAASQIAALLDDPAKRIFDEYTHRAQIGELPVNDSLALGHELAERLRVRKRLAWISYSDAKTGDFTGAWHDKEGNVILNRSSPKVNGGLGKDELVGTDGQLTPYIHAKPETYDPRETEWFARAANSDVTAWSAPYDFADGQYGITASQSWRESGSSKAAGVFTVDFLLADLDYEMQLLSSPHRNDYVCVFQPNGQLLCAPGYMRKQPISMVGELVKTTYGTDQEGAYNQLLTVNQNGVKYMVALHSLTTSTGMKCVVASLSVARDVYAEASRTAVDIAEVGLVLLCVALAVGWGIAKRISFPLGVLSRDLQKVGDFDFSPGALKKSIFRELHILIESSERMKSGLRSFLRYVPEDLVRQLLHSGKDAELGVEPRHLTIFFSDIENFTGYSERVPKEQLVLDLSDYFDILTRAVRRNSGTIDKFIGDGLLAFFNAPFDVANHEQRACEAALAAVQELQPAGGHAEVSGAGKTPFRTRISLHAGDVLVGNVGTHERFAYTVLGDAVNACSRIEALNKVYGTSILASAKVRDKAGDGFEWRHVDRVAVAGRKGTINIHELLGVKGGGVDAGILRARDIYEEALGRYFARDFARARELFVKAGEARSGDRAAEMMMQRCDDLGGSRPEGDWDGVFVHTHK